MTENVTQQNKCYPSYYLQTRFSTTKRTDLAVGTWASDWPTPAAWIGSRSVTTIIIVHTLWFHGEGVGGICSAVRCAVLLLYQVLRPAVVQGVTVVDRPPSPDRSLARRRSPAAAVGSVRGPLYCYRIHMVGSWGGCWWIFACCVLCCPTAVPGTTSCCIVHRSSAVARSLARLRAVARSPPPPSGGLWPPSRLARHRPPARSLARRRSIARRRSC